MEPCCGSAVTDASVASSLSGGDSAQIIIFILLYFYFLQKVVYIESVQNDRHYLCIRICISVGINTLECSKNKCYFV